ncbi:MAG: hypothetical protein AAGB51_14920 [Planctomycetota bacterium]
MIALQPKAFEQLGGRYRLVANSIMQEFSTLNDDDHTRAIENFDSLVRALQRGLEQVSEVDRHD